MNLFENLQMMRESENAKLTDKQKAVINIANNDIDAYEGGSKPFKYSYSVSGYQDALNYIKDVMELSDNELKQDIDKEIRNISLSHEYENKEIKKESIDKNNLWDKFNKVYYGVMPIQDLANYCGLDEFGEFVKYCLDEADEDYDRDKIYHSFNDCFNDLNRAFGKFGDLNDVDLNIVFNFFSTDDLEDLWDWVETEYDLGEDDLEESIQLKEASTNKSGYTLNFGAWRTGNGMSFASKNELVSFLRSNYIDLETVITYCENVTNDFKNSMHKVNNAFIKDEDAQKKFFDRGYVKIVDVKNDDLEESVKLEKLSIGKKLQTVFDKFDSNTKLVGFMLQYIDEDTIEKMYNEIAGIEEATSGIGGAYTTKAIDMFPSKNIKKVNENLYDEYLERVMDEKSNAKLINLLHEIKNNNKLKANDKKKLEDKIKNKTKNK